MKQCHWNDLVYTGNEGDDKANETRNLHWAVAPLLIVSRVVGLAPFKSEEGRLVPSKIYLVYSVVFVIANIIMAIFFRRSLVLVSLSIQHVAWLLCEAGFATSYVVSMLRMIYACQQLAEATARVSHHHHLLPQKPAVYARYRFYLFFALTSVLFAAAVSSNAGLATAVGSRSLPLRAVTFLQNLQICVAELMFVALVAALLLTLQSLNAEAEALALEGPLPQRRDRARSLRVIQSDACEAAEAVGGVFAPVMLVGVARSFVILTCSLFLLLGNMLSDGKRQQPAHALWCAQTALRLVAVAAACARATAEAKRTGIVIHKTMVTTTDPEIREELELLSLQLMHRQIQFTACDFFPIDYTLLYSIVGSVTTYMVILLQFKIASDLESNKTTTPFPITTLSSLTPNILN